MTEVTEAKRQKSNHSQNACKLCTPLGACLVFKGIRKAMPYLHGSQGCATYIRRYMISHFREPIDIASSNFSEQTTVFGGRDNLHRGLDNICRQYEPEMIGIATTCLSETIGEDLPMLLHEYRQTRGTKHGPVLVHVSTPSYSGTHVSGYHGAVRAVVESLCLHTTPGEFINILPSMVSPGDLRYLHRVLNDFGLQHVMLPDYSQTLDDGTWRDYKRLSDGGTSLDEIRSMGDAQATIQLGRVAGAGMHAGELMDKRFQVPCFTLGVPCGVKETDAFFARLEGMTGRMTPSVYRADRNRLIDSYVDAHKYVFGKRVVVYGEDDLVVGLTAMLCECGLRPVLCATGNRTGRFEAALRETATELPGSCVVKEGADFSDIDAACDTLEPDLLVGNSKGYKTARRRGIPLVRVGFPIHDRIGAQRIRVLGYDGTQRLFDRVVNAILEARQDGSEMGFTYL